MTTSSHKIVWDKCLELIKDNISIEPYKTWFSPIKSLSLVGHNLTVEVPSDYVREHIETNYLNLVTAVVRHVIAEDAKLFYNVRIGSAAIKVPQSEAKKNVDNKAITDPRAAKEYDGSAYLIPGLANKTIKIDSQLNPLFNFENFIEGDCNKLGRAAGVSIAAKPGHNTFNPLFIYGGPGLGKTHLAQAIGIAIKEQHPEKIVLYVSANLFMTQYMDAVGRDNKMTDFLRFYQSLDVLIIDDVHEFAEKRGTQNAFFQIFNYMHQSGKQLILTSDRPPVELQGLEQRLLSRFKWGLSVELTTPNYETRLSIIKEKSQREGVEIPEDVLQFIATKVKSNVRELEGTLFSLMANATFAKRDITLSLAQDIVEKIVEEYQPEITVERIQDVVCSYFNISNEVFASKTRKSEIVQARQIAMYLSRNLTKVSLSSIGTQIGGKNHATVLHACNAVSDMMQTDRSFKQTVNEIERCVVTAN